MDDHSELMRSKHGRHLSQETHDAVYAKAWRDGHSSGMDEVEHYYIELVDFVDDILRLEKD